ncbi:MAG: hypothetical protein MJY56_03365 [Bacteroidales bacterium]|nr:hypothetical protein [Bacteroidales bacterium]
MNKKLFAICFAVAAIMLSSCDWLGFDNIDEGEIPDSCFTDFTSSEGIPWIFPSEGKIDYRIYDFSKKLISGRISVTDPEVRGGYNTVVRIIMDEIPFAAYDEDKYDFSYTSSTPDVTVSFDYVTAPGPDVTDGLVLEHPQKAKIKIFGTMTATKDALEGEANIYLILEDGTKIRLRFDRLVKAK